ncbi:hypothetical protein A2716_04080 [candidate division WWE3 bacterium RIFCSPHIGHO2_01_FULL_40_23]|uniref:L,D-TPase catalytic domain-containing protein n=1 Tax=candidate division WWE3 bacterium RIFCSPLOWO2_01_FULL_41_18 TaxID=1802625 RepID=A0A1F4VD07_UNCKA|nr:MAG: hypothetical protein A2716_04080 [candidate division WWE3 bacterium RIFCSPHIGHO2_01_FULL_40_23]OGC55054.1 MAG: hypothetical protein A3A78_03690 [candidate division WWE3 bacterium RIFCSPLOWO2_01_FULL_41_18]
MRKIPALLLVAILISLSFFIKSESRIKPGVKIGSLNLSYLKKDEALEKLSVLETKPLYFNLVNRSISQNYNEIGVSFDKETVNQFIRQCYLKYLCLPKLSRTPPVSSLIKIDNSKLETFLNELNKDFQKNELAPAISFDDATFYAQAPDSKFQIDKENIKKTLTPEAIQSKDPISIKITEINQGSLNLQHEETDKLIEKITSTPLLIKYGRNPVYIYKNDLSKFVDTRVEDGKKIGFLNESAINDYLNLLIQKYKTDLELNDDHAAKSIMYALLYRAGEEKLNEAVILPLIGRPKTDGKVHDKYLELNKSQQRIFTFENGELKETYVVGTGLTAETPSGNFRILKKLRMSFSYWGNWYLPYMMPVGQFPNGNYFGIHEIPYHQDAYGNIYSRDENTMGSPATGGCIQMYREDVKELWDWVDIGTPVIITD